MTNKNDIIGNTLRDFYAMFGMADEGPPEEFNVTNFISGYHVPEGELELLRSAIDDQNLRQQFNMCHKILEDLATRLTTEELLHELSGLPQIQEPEYDELSSGVLWFSLAASLDQRQNGLPITPSDQELKLPLPVKIQMTVQGSLVFRLYISLVYMREGILNNLITEGSRIGNECCGRVKKLLNCDYVRRIRNALSHGSFSSCVVGLVFRDDAGIIVATPGFLNWLCMWLMLIQLQAASASTRAETE